MNKLERLIVCLGIFVVFLIVLVIVVIVCYFYEYVNKEYWFYGKWDNRIVELNLSIFMLKFFMLLFVGIILGIWIWLLKIL